jgi:cytochrome c1
MEKFMNRQLAHGVYDLSMALSLTTTFAALVLLVSPAIAQNPDLQAKLAQIKVASAANKQALSHYNWQESVTTSIKGEVKKQQTYLVSVGPNGQQQKSEINAQPDQASGGPLKRHIVAKKKAEFQDYGAQIADLARQYTQPDPERLQQAYQQGNISMQLGGGETSTTLVIKNYIKPNDSVTLVFNKQSKAIQSVRVASYLDDPKDAVTIAAQFAKLPNGINHVTGTQINGASKQLTVVTQNSNYQPI